VAEVEITFNKIRSLSYFQIFLYLKELSLVYCQIGDLKGLEGLSNTLEILRLVNCGLEVIDKQILKMRRLKEISLAENNIKEIKNLQK
jgi:Leucine-rich repeat (LRR) protein